MPEEKIFLKKYVATLWYMQHWYKPANWISLEHTNSEDTYLMQLGSMRPSAAGPVLCAIWQLKWRHLVAKLVTNASSAAWWPKLKSMESLTWIFFSTEFVFFSTGEMTSYRINTLGPLCLWQCLTLHPHFYCVSILCIWRLSQRWSISEISH